VIAVLLIGAGCGHSGKTPRRARAVGASIRALNAFAGSIGHPVYWAGPRPRFTYELSRTKDGRVYVRYLPPGVKPGDPKSSYLTVGTYPQRHAFATLRATVKKQKASPVRLFGGGLAFQYKSRPTSMYLAYPGSDYQVEVFDPSPARARHVVVSGEIKPVGAPPRTPAGSRAATVQQLKALAVELGHPIYWAGGEQDVTYELTRTADGSVWVRYLPLGVHIGDPRPDFLSVGTYPQKNAYAILKATAAKTGAELMTVGGGGLAFDDRKRPASVYLAYPRQALQIEVFDPRPGRAKSLVLSARIGRVR
jgi:hypothetical protein